MNRTKRWIAAGAVAVVALGAGSGIALAGGGDDDATEQPITGTELAQASKAALAETGGGSVVATEIHDQEGYYEVEVKLGDGSSVDVHLDQSFKVVDSAPDGANDKSDDQGQN
jgi:uncharacterized membrane protein YkoI